MISTDWIVLSLIGLALLWVFLSTRRVGTKSILFGAHQFAIHPWFVARAWWKLYGFPWNPKLWIVFFIHDLGYWGKKDMDGPDGERHVEFGAKLAHFLLDWKRCRNPFCLHGEILSGDSWSGSNFYKCLDCLQTWYWYDLCLYHSRFYAKKNSRPFSRLCVADKLAIVITPWWIYKPLSNLSGEIHEYIARANTKYEHENLRTTSQSQWHKDMVSYLTRWVEHHKDLKEDTWTQTPTETPPTQTT